MARLEKIFLATMIFGSMGLILLIRPSLGHNGHDRNNDTSNIEKTQKLAEEYSDINGKMEKIEKQSPQSNQIHLNQQMQMETLDSDTQVSPYLKQLNLKPQPTELVFFLMLVSPYLIYTVRKKMYNKESN